MRNTQYPGTTISVTFAEVAASTRPVGLECGHCYRRALLDRQALKAQPDDMRTLQQGGVRCGKCGSRDFSAILFASRGKATSFLRNH